MKKNQHWGSEFGQKCNIERVKKYAALKNRWSSLSIQTKNKQRVHAYK